VNERIRVREVRLIDDDGTQLGVVPTREALERARSKNMDLIEVAPTAVPPVCRIMDYGKYKYETSKREREAHKKQRAGEMKGIRMRPRTDEHDYLFKLRNTRKFLQEGDKIKATVIFHSREIAHPEFGRSSLERLAQDTADIAVVEKPASLEGRTITMILSPKA
jgi:translation initiation factor IF-3